MVKYYSTITNEYYDTEKELIDAENAEKDCKSSIKKQIVEIKAKCRKEVAEKERELDSLSEQLETYSNTMKAIMSDIDEIKDDIESIKKEADYEISELVNKIRKKNCSCSCNHSQDTKSDIDEMSNEEKINECLKSLKNSSEEVKKILSLFNI